jgi:hypothetical protein
MSHRRILLATAAALAVLAGIGPTASAAPRTARRMQVSVWLERGGRLWLSTRSVKAAPAVATAALERLFAGPTAGERAAGVRSAVPAGTRLRGISIAAGTATIDVSRTFAAAAGRKRIRVRLAQLTFTATQFATVRRVQLEVAGQVVQSIAGAPVPQPASRSDFHRLLPAIVVARPTIGAHIPATVTVTGTADVFEAALTVRIVNERGRLVARRHILATCGTGCRGKYTVTTTYHVRRSQPGTVVIFDRGGRVAHPHIVRVPVTLAAG